MRLVGVGPPQAQGRRLRVGSMLRGTGHWEPEEDPQAAGTPEQTSVFSSETASVHVSWGAPGSWGPACPSAYKVLEGRPEGAGQSHTLIAERSPLLGRHQGVWKGGLETCAHVCTHVHAYGHTHVHTHVPGRPRAHLHAHNQCTWPPRCGSDVEAATAVGAQQSTGTPSVEKIMPVVGS